MSLPPASGSKSRRSIRTSFLYRSARLIKVLDLVGVPTVGVVAVVATNPSSFNISLGLLVNALVLGA
jgi:hypothetical protein